VEKIDVTGSADHSRPMPSIATGSIPATVMGARPR
jgi:hypothetical protein